MLCSDSFPQQPRTEMLCALPWSKLLRTEAVTSAASAFAGRCFCVHQCSTRERVPSLTSLLYLFNRVELFSKNVLSATNDDIQNIRIYMEYRDSKGIKIKKKAGREVEGREGGGKRGREERREPAKPRSVRLRPCPRAQQGRLVSVPAWQRPPRSAGSLSDPRSARSRPRGDSACAAASP